MTGAIAGAVPLPGVDPVVPLASTLAVTGTTAVLLGAGISRAADIKTAWEVTQDLVRVVAAQQGLLHPDLGDNPETWWRATHGGRDPRYDELLELLAPNEHDRRELLGPYFTQTTGGAPAGPSQAHRDLADLAAEGRVRVIVTTNFDRLMEDALTARGVAAQIVNDAGQVTGMTPLVHAPVTVIKVHGDYRSGPMRNTEAELGTYPSEWQDLLRQVFNEYGLLVIGWSGDTDAALISLLEQTVGRRYTWYWAAHHNQLTDRARRLIDAHPAHVIDSSGADGLLRDLRKRIDGIERRQLQRSRPRRTPTAGNRIGNTYFTGWSQSPQFVVHARASFGPASTETASPMGPGTRERVADALNGSDLADHLLQLQAHQGPAISEVQTSPGVDCRAPIPELAGDETWQTLVDQSTSTRAVWRLGPATPGSIGGLAAVTLPGGHPAGEVRIDAYAGLNLEAPVPLEAFARLLLALADLVALQLPPALTVVTPPDAELTRVELQWAPVAQYQGQNVPQTAGPRVEATSLGLLQPTGFEGTYAETADEFTGSADLALLVVNGLQIAALDSKTTDSRPGLLAVATALGVNDWTPL